MTSVPADLLSAIVTLLAVILYFYMSVRVSRMRTKYGVKAPATTGHPEFERAFRVHYNTMESLVAFLPLLWLATFYFAPAFYALAWLPPALGLAWIVGRIFYMNGYMAGPDKRGVGFGIASLAQLLLLVLAIVGIVRVWIAIAA
ncbi:MAG TPA: MAPEG family protein [Rhizomicrobium sp.]